MYYVCRLRGAIETEKAMEAYDRGKLRRIPDPKKGEEEAEGEATKEDEERCRAAKGKKS